MSGRGRGGGGGGRGAYYKAKYGNKGRNQSENEDSRHFDQPRSHGTSMRAGTADELSRLLIHLDGKSYPAYKDMYGTWNYEGFTLLVDYIQGDAFAGPSKFRVRIPHDVARIPSHLWNNSVRAVATRDFLARTFADAVSQAGGDIRQGSSSWHGAKGGEITVDRPSQEVLDRTAVLLTPDFVEARFTLALPAAGRSILGRMAQSSLVEMLPRYVRQGLYYSSVDTRALQRHVTCVEDADYIRCTLPSLGLVAFVGNGSILPRCSGASDQPMPARDAVPFLSPDTLQVEVPLPGNRTVRGMGIPQGVTVICGGGFHGKSTLLRALERGVYNHIPGDGREVVITNSSAVKIRAEDGRKVDSVDISMFIGDLPYGKRTDDFSTTDASGSTSQAANIQEAIEAGSSCLLLDEDTCATNFMIRDARMQTLVAVGKEPIRPFISRVQGLAAGGISSILVVGGCGEYFDVADKVICMDEFKPVDATVRAKEISEQFMTPEQASNLEVYKSFSLPMSSTSFRMVQRVLPRDAGRIKVRSLGVVHIGELELDLCRVEQIVDCSQTRAIADTLRYVDEHLSVLRRSGSGLSVREILDHLDTLLAREGLDGLSTDGHVVGNYALPRRFEVAAALNRIRSAEICQRR